MPRVIYENGRYPFPAAANLVPGQLAARPDGSYGLYDGVENVASGTLISPEPLKPGPIVEFEKNAAGDNLAAGTVVYAIPASDKITATATSNIRVGKITRAAGVGVTHALVNTVE